MPPIETSDLRQYALLWVKSGVDNYGNRTFDEPIQILCRWENRQIDIRDRLGNTLTTDAICVVNREVTIGSLMRLGSESEWEGTGSSEEDNDVMEVVRVYAIPDLKNRVTRRTLYLMRYKGGVPQ